MRWRRHWKIPLLLAGLMIALVAAMGDQRIIAYVGKGGDTSWYAPTVDYDNPVDLFDDTLVHSIALNIDEADLEAMVRLYLGDGTKEWFSADITIDGVTIHNVGVRLKGNSTLRSALMTATSRVNYDELPYLVKLDRFTEGVSYQGVTELALRTEGPTEDEALIEEMASGWVYSQVGLAFPRTSYTGLAINGEAETLRVVAENPDESYVERIFEGADGILYKANTGGSFAYLGHDPTAYADSFSQETAVNDHDLAPLIDLLEFVDSASDAEFEEELADWVDIDSFVDYLAVSNLLVNVDSMAGTGHNYYLWYDLETERFTILAWDLNESLGGFWHSTEASSTLLPDWSNATVGGPGGGFGGPRGGGLGQAPPSQVDRPAIVDGAAGDGAASEERAAPGGAMPDQFDTSNALVTRFLAIDAFRALYEERYAELYEEIFESLTYRIEAIAGLLASADEERDLLADGVLSQAVWRRLDFAEQREEFLAGLGVGG